MVTKGIITSIDFNGNTCQVRIPFFETAGNDPITGTAIVSNTPGSYNGYKIGDVVLVAFEDGKMHNPVIIGKLYLGAAKEKQDPRGTINVETTTASKSASLPADAVLTANVDSNVPNTNTPFGSLASIANNLNSLNTDVNQLDRFTRNQFNSVITDVNEQGDQIRSEIKQTADSIEANVVHKHQDGSQDALGWDLTTDSWQINAQDTVNGEVKDINIVTIDRSGMSIAGDLKLSGYPRNITVLYAQTGPNENYPELYNFTEVKFPVPFPSVGEDKDKTWYYGKYIKITDDSEEKYVLVFKENFEQYQITVGTTVAYSRNINPSWSTEAPGRADGKYIWQWTHTEIYSFDGDKWSEKDDDKIVCITGAQGEKGDAGVAINNNKQWYILWPASATNKPSKPTNNTEPTEPATPSTVESWMSTPPEAVNGYVVWTCYGSIFSDDTPEKRHIEYSDPVKDNAYALAQGKTTNYYSDTDPSKAYSVKKGDCWFKTISSTNDEYNNEMSDQNQGKLYQCSGFDADGKAIWEDVGGELVANKLTANYINALDITAKKITVLDQDDSTKKLFEADGINGAGKVSIANFTVKNDKLYSGEHDTIDSTKAGIYLGSKGLSIGSNFRITTDSVIISDYTKSITKKYSITDFDTVPNPAPEWWENWNSTNWKTTPPSREDKKYIWEWTKEVKGNGNETNLHVCITGAKGDPGKDGTDGLIPSIGQNGNWWLGDKDTGIKAEGTDGHTPKITIGENGNWYIDGVDTGVLAEGIPGEPGKTGRSVLSVTKFYKTATSKPNPPNVKDPTDWYMSPPSFVKGNNYYESDRTIYDSVDSTGKDYSWSGVIENSMLTVDFINSLGITAQGLKVVNGNNTILSANIAGETENVVKIGGFTVGTNSLESGTSGTSNYVKLGTDEIKLGTEFSVNSSGAIKSTSGTIGNLKVTTNGLRYENSTYGNFYIGEPSTDIRIPKYAIQAQRMLINSAYFGPKLSSDGTNSAHFIGLDENGLSTYFSANNTAVTCTSRIPIKDLRHIPVVTLIGITDSDLSKRHIKILCSRTSNKVAPDSWWTATPSGFNKIIYVFATCDANNTNTTDNDQGLAGYNGMCMTYISADGKTIYIGNDGYGTIYISYMVIGY